MPKVVYNACAGGYGLSAEAARLLVDDGHAELLEEVRKDRELNPWLSEEQLLAYAAERVPRDDPALVRVVKKLGAAADGEYAALAVCAVPDGEAWELLEHGGQEEVVAPIRYWSKRSDL
jgi:hypothetical protein